MTDLEREYNDGWAAVQDGLERMLAYLEVERGVEIDQCEIDERLLEAIYEDRVLLALAAAK